MKQLICTFLIFFFSVCAQAQIISVNSGWGFNTKTVKASRNVITKDVTPKGEFQGLQNNTPADVYYQVANDYSVTIKADDNIIDFLIIEKEGDNLIIKLKKNTSFKKAKAFEVHINSPELTGVALRSSGDFYSEDQLNTKNFELRLFSSGDAQIEGIHANNVILATNSSGDISIEKGVKAESIALKSASSGDIETAINTEMLTVALSSSGDLLVQGSAKIAKLKTSSSGDILGFGLTANEVEAQTSSSGDIELTVTDRLNAKTSSSGDIIYKGNPIVQKRESSSGEVYSR